LKNEADKKGSGQKSENLLRLRVEPINLKAALIHYLAEKKGINITLNHLYQIFGKPNYVITENKKIIKQILEEEHFLKIKLAFIKLQTRLKIR
jgi:hypothetical protein